MIARTSVLRLFARIYAECAKTGIVVGGSALGLGTVVASKPILFFALWILPVVAAFCLALSVLPAAIGTVLTLGLRHFRVVRVPVPQVVGGLVGATLTWGAIVASRDDVPFGSSGGLRFWGLFLLAATIAGARSGRHAALWLEGVATDQ